MYRGKRGGGGGGVVFDCRKLVKEESINLEGVIGLRENKNFKPCFVSVDISIYLLTYQPAS